MADFEDRLLILTCDVLEHLYKQSFEKQKKEAARKRRSRTGKI